jgi:hypothetical protein
MCGRTGWVPRKRCTPSSKRSKRRKPIFTGGLFGSNVVVGTTGLLLDNGMRLGSTSPYPGHVNYVGPGKIPILNNSPVIVLKDGRLNFVFGTPGGETIGQTEFQMLVNLIDFDLPMQATCRMDSSPFSPSSCGSRRSGRSAQWRSPSADTARRHWRRSGN